MFCRLKSCNPVVPVNCESRKFKDVKIEQVVKLEDISKDLQNIVKLQACSYAKFKLSEKLKVLSDDFPVVARLIDGQIIKNQESHHQLIKILSDAKSHQVTSIQIPKLFSHNNKIISTNNLMPAFSTTFSSTETNESFIFELISNNFKSKCRCELPDSSSSSNSGHVSGQGSGCPNGAG